MVIALDGPAGAGKSSVAQAVAGALHFTYLDTGAMYRCVGLATLRSGDPAAQVAERIQIALGARVMLDGEDVSEAIRSAEASAAASQVAAIPEVRRALVDQQRRLLSAGGDWVAEGRDIGTVVWPQAELKLFVTAAPEERARRRAAQTGQLYEEVLADQQERDERDTGRADSPLRPASDSIEIDTTGLSQQEVVAHVVELVGRRGGASNDRPAGDEPMSR